MQTSSDLRISEFHTKEVQRIEMANEGSKAKELPKPKVPKSLKTHPFSTGDTLNVGEHHLYEVVSINRGKATIKLIK